VRCVYRVPFFALTCILATREPGLLLLRILAHGKIPWQSEVQLLCVSEVWLHPVRLIHVLNSPRRAGDAGTAIQIYGDYDLTATIAVSLDGQPFPVIVGVDSPTCEELMFERTDLQDQDHTITITQTGGSGGLGLSSFV
jgi:hypothetical protein